jgi:myo-inositol-1(or 4)-monophosphatase
VPLDRALVATGFGYGSEDRRRQASVVAVLLPRVRDIRRAGSAALDLCSVAAGRVDGYFEDTPSRWDWAAGALIAAEAGAVVTPLPAPHGRAGVLAAGPALHADLTAFLRP